MWQCLEGCASFYFEFGKNYESDGIVDSAPERTNKSVRLNYGRANEKGCQVKLWMSGGRNESCEPQSFKKDRREGQKGMKDKRGKDKRG
jgi:hypothetical protein